MIPSDSEMKEVEGKAKDENELMCIDDMPSGEGGNSYHE
jgi:hypothetical protein